MHQTFPSVHSFPFRKDWEHACWKILITSPETFEPLMTTSERHNLVMRAVVVHRIRSGKGFQQIAEELWLSPQTISAIKKAMQRDAYQSYRERGKRERKKKLYSSTPARPRILHSGKPVRTKYGTVHLP